MNKDYYIGTNAHTDHGVIIGYRTGRSIKQEKTIIGNHSYIRTNTVIYCNVTVGDYLQTGHNVVIREENTIGNYFSIWNNSTVDYGCNIGNNVKIHSNVYVAQYTTIEDDVFLAPGVITTNDPHPVCTKCMKGPFIKRGARIGANTTLLPHVIIGEYAVIGAGSVVTKNVHPYSLVYGNPARNCGTIHDLRCHFNYVDKPYVDGLDVQAREKLGIPTQDK
ncbi:MAG: N-acetyltransferase [Planctomycetes bacterium]|nr:N-acetyltransferase [Planctomycetota bacterium]